MTEHKLHTHLNSDSLKEQHADIYRQFFASCPVVVSASVPLTWTPSQAVSAGGIGIVFKLPLRIYVGLEPRREPGVSLGLWQHYLPEEDRFQEVPVPDPRVVDLEEKLIEKWIESEIKEGGPKGINIRLLSEAPFYRGMGVGPAIAIGISSLLHVIAGKLEPSALEELSKKSSTDLAKDPIFDSLFRLAWRLESINDSWISPGDVLFGSFISSKYPVIFFRERDPVLFDRYQDHGIEHPASYYNHARSLFFNAFRFDELVPLEPAPQFPFEWALLYIGEEGSASQTYQYQKSAMAEFQDTAEFVKKIMANRVSTEFREPPQFLELAEDKLGEDPAIRVYKRYRKIPVIHSLTIFKLLQDIFARGSSPERLRLLFRELNSAQDILHITGQSTFHKDRACTILRECGYEASEVGVAVVPRMSGVVVVMGQKLTLEPAIRKAMEEIKKKTEKSVHCHFASWCDGLTEEGARVDQHVAAGIYAPFVQSERVILKEWGSDGRVTSLLTTIEKLEQDRASYDIFFDGLEGKVFVRGKALTSQELHSAKQTLELFAKFFGTGKKELESKELPESFYREDRNQMESKLIRPIVTVVKRETGQRLGLEIHGGLGTNYKVNFTPPNSLRVGLVRREE